MGGFRVSKPPGVFAFARRCGRLGPGSTRPVAMDQLGFSILYHNGPCLVVNKPSGVLTQAPPGIDSLEARIRAWVAASDPKPFAPYLGVPHRLDRPASGAMVFALSARAARKISKQFERRHVRKLYWALVAGHVEPEVGFWLDFIRKVPGEPRAEIVEKDHPEGRTAILNYRKLGEWDDASWLEIELQTGRTHQIRVQAAHRSHPILGDAFYGSDRSFGPACDDPRSAAIALHARRLELTDPTSREPVAATAPLPDYWPAPPGAIDA